MSTAISDGYGLRYHYGGKEGTEQVGNLLEGCKRPEILGNEVVKALGGLALRPTSAGKARGKVPTVETPVVKGRSEAPVGDASGVKANRKTPSAAAIAVKARSEVPVVHTDQLVPLYREGRIVVFTPRRVACGSSDRCIRRNIRPWHGHRRGADLRRRRH